MSMSMSMSMSKEMVNHPKHNNHPSEIEASKEMVNHPRHYNNHPSEIEAIDVIRSMCFNIGNGFKYIYRRNDKNNAIQDLKKAIWYIDDEIERRNKWDILSSRSFLCLYSISRDKTSTLSMLIVRILYIRS